MLNDARGFSRVVIACGRTDLLHRLLVNINKPTNFGRKPFARVNKNILRLCTYFGIEHKAHFICSRNDFPTACAA